MSLVLWVLAFLCLVGVIEDLCKQSPPFLKCWSFHAERKNLTQVLALFQFLKEQLLVGMMPAPKDWNRLGDLHEPWGLLSQYCLLKLRAQGASLLPTLTRLENLALDQIEYLSAARAMSSQGLAQAAICTSLVPVFGFSAYFVFPGLKHFVWLWVLSCAVAFLLSLGGSFWILQMVLQCRWAGLPQRKSAYFISGFCALEWFLAQLRSGQTPDAAWCGACQFLEQCAPDLAQIWGTSIWQEQSVLPAAPVSEVEQIFIDVGHAVKRCVYLSLMEGKPCAARVEQILGQLKQDVHAQLKKEAQLLSVRVLKPLFVCVAPALLGLVAVAVSGVFLYARVF